MPQLTEPLQPIDYQEHTNPWLVVYARALITPAGNCIAPAAILLEHTPAGPTDWHVVAVGTSTEIDAHPASFQAKKLDFPRSVLLPGLVNAHTHLDLTHINPQPHDPRTGFVPWVEMIRAGRLTDDTRIGASVQRGIELSRAGGSVAIGDISGFVSGSVSGSITVEPYRQLAASGMLGVSFLEFFGIGSTETRFATLFMDHIADILTGASHPVVKDIELADAPSPRTRLGLQPHAPNTVDIRQYMWAMVRARLLGWPVCTHVGESIEEREFIARGTGPQRDMLERVGIWDDDILHRVGQGATPITHLMPAIECAQSQSSPMLLAHANDATDSDIAQLAQANVAVAYCPRAHEYFGAAAYLGPHRYRDMLDAGIPVALGTDSIVNLPGAAADTRTGGMSILDEMRLLHARDSTDPLTLLQMATVHGARALGLAPELFSLEPNSATAGIVAIEVSHETATDTHHLLGDVCTHRSPCTLIVGAGV